MFVALDPVPLAHACTGLFVGKDEQVFGVAAGYVLPNAHALLLVGPAAVGYHLYGDHTTQLGYGAAGEGGIKCGIIVPACFRTGLVPAQHVDEQADKVERSEVRLEGGEV